MAIIIYLVLSFQNHLPLNQLIFPAVDPYRCRARSRRRK
jgi:hypothetical protein